MFRSRIPSSGTFDAIKHVFIAFTPDGVANVGPTQIVAGTGDHAGIVDHWVNVSETDHENAKARARSPALYG